MVAVVVVVGVLGAWAMFGGVCVCAPGVGGLVVACEGKWGGCGVWRWWWWWGGGGRVVMADGSHQMRGVIPWGRQKRCVLSPVARTPCGVCVRTGFMYRLVCRFIFAWICACCDVGSDFD